MGEKQDDSNHKSSLPDSQTEPSTRKVSTKSPQVPSKPVVASNEWSQYHSNINSFVDPQSTSFYSMGSFDQAKYQDQYPAAYPPPSQHQPIGDVKSSSDINVKSRKTNSSDDGRAAVSKALEAAEKAVAEIKENQVEYAQKLYNNVQR